MKLRFVSHLSQPLVKVTMQWTHHVELTSIYDVDITSIGRKENIDKFLRHFDVLFQCSFDGRKIDVVSTYFVWRNFDEQNLDVVSISFSDMISMDEKSTLFRCIFW